MRVKISRLRPWMARALVVGVVGVAAACGSQEQDMRCGPGTELRGGACVGVEQSDTECGPGTERDPSTGVCNPRVTCAEGTVPSEDGTECLPEAQCGPGTIPDLETGECIPEAVCGEGTVLDESGNCVTLAECGPGTVLQDGVCEANEPCTSGTQLDPSTGRCVNLLACEGADRIVVEGVCRSVIDALGAEVTVREESESTGLGNDPTYGGTPQPITLPALGETLVFAGNIDRPANRDADPEETPEQDRDVWSFTGSAGQYLRIRVVSNGLPQPVFILRGPDGTGYERRSVFGYYTKADRYVLLPYDGEYQLEVGPSVHYTQGALVGGTGFGYLASVSHEPWPAATPFAPTRDVSMPVQAVGDYFAQEDSLFLIQAAVGTPIELRIADATSQTPPAFLVFSSSGGELVLDAVVEATKGAWAPLVIAAADDTLVYVDWISSVAPTNERTFQVLAGAAPDEALPVGPGTSTTLGGYDWPGYFTAIESLSVTQPCVLEVNVNNGSGPDTWVYKDGAPFAQLGDKSSYLLLGDPGVYAFFTHNDAATTYSDASLGIAAWPIFDSGALDPASGGSTTLSSAADEGFKTLRLDGSKGFEPLWFVGRTSAAGVLGFELSLEVGNARLQMYGRDGSLIRNIVGPERLREIFSLHDGADAVIYRVANYDIDANRENVPIRAWQARLRAYPVPAVAEEESNDTSGEADALPAFPTMVQGTIGIVTSSGTDDAYDWYSFTLPSTPPAEGTLVEVRFDNLGGSVATSEDNDAARIKIFDDTLTSLSPLPHKNDGGTSADRYGAIGANAVAIFRATTQGPFYIQLWGYDVDDGSPYVLSVREASVAVETEPNGGPDDYTTLSALPASIVGYLNDVGTDDVDYYQFTLDTPLDADEAVVVQLWSLFANDTYTASTYGLRVRLQSAITTPTTYADEASNTVELVVKDLAAGTYYVNVTDDFADSPPYLLRVQRLTIGEPSPNSEASPASLGALGASDPLTVSGVVSKATADAYTFTIDPPLAANEGLRILGANYNKRRTFTVDLMDGATVAESAYGYGAVAILGRPASGTGPVTVRVRDTGTDADAVRYDLRIERLASITEVEPNDDSASAYAAGDLPLTVHGTVINGTTDFYQFELPQTLFANQAVRVRAANLRGSDAALTVRIYDAGDSKIYEKASSSFTATTMQGVASGTYFLEVTRTASTTLGPIQYRVTLDIVEVE